MRKQEPIDENRRLEEMFETSAIATSFCLSFIQRRFKDQLSDGERAIFIMITILNLVDLIYLIGLNLTKIKNRRESEGCKDKAVFSVNQ